MAFQRPNLTQLIAQFWAYAVAQLPGADAALRRSNLKVLARAVPGLVNGEYGYMDWGWRQVFASTAEADYLDVQGAEYNLPRLGASPAAGNVVFSGTAGAGVPADTLVQDSNGMQFFTLAAGAIGGGGTVSLAVQAVNGGANGNETPGTTLTLANALAGVNGTATVDTSGITGGTDSESDSAYRARILGRKQQPPQGGTQNDYQTWAKASPLGNAVTRAWALPQNSGPGTCDLSFVCDGQTPITPTGAQISTMQTWIASKRPVTDGCTVFAPVLSPVNFSISGLPVASRAAVTAALTALLAHTVIGGSLSFQDQIVPAIAAAAAGQPFTLTAPSADLPAIAGSLYTMGSVTYS